MEGCFELYVDVWVSKIGNSSFVVQYEMKSKAGIHAKALTVQVAVDAESKRSRPLNGEELELLNEYLEA